MIQYILKVIQYLNSNLNNQRPNIPTGMSSTSAYRPTNYAGGSTLSHNKYGSYSNNINIEDVNKF